MSTLMVGGVIADMAVGDVGDLEWENAWPKGPWEATWQMNLPPNFVHPKVTRGESVKILEGPRAVWGGRLKQPVFNGDTWEFTAVGHARAAETTWAFNSLLESTSRPRTALKEAVARGLPWSLPADAAMSNTDVASTDVTDQLNRLDTLLDAWCDTAGTRWGLTPDGLFYTQADPSTPSLHILPGSAVLGVADNEDGASVIYGRYKSTSTTFATVTATGTGEFLERVVDLTDRGVLTSGEAQSVVDGMLIKGADKPAWANGFTLTRDQLVTAGGTSVHLPFVGIRPTLVRQLGAFDPVARRTNHVDFMIGRTRYRAGSNTVDVTPLGVAKATTLRSAIAAAGPAAANLRG